MIGKTENMFSFNDSYNMPHYLSTRVNSHGIINYLILKDINTFKNEGKNPELAISRTSSNKSKNVDSILKI